MLLFENLKVFFNVQKFNWLFHSLDHSKNDKLEKNVLNELNDFSLKNIISTPAAIMEIFFYKPILLESDIPSKTSVKNNGTETLINNQKVY